ncbi:hypothetical protein APHNYW_1615 [Anaplasma phagocytophilum str. ApNYW]|nr:hypothetical protein APHNYW_1615 [Anaplasma phagocytophilum str. ApNYW]
MFVLVAMELWYEICCVSSMILDRNRHPCTQNKIQANSLRALKVLRGYVP